MSSNAVAQEQITGESWLDSGQAYLGVDHSKLSKSIDNAAQLGPSEDSVAFFAELYLLKSGLAHYTGNYPSVVTWADSAIPYYEALDDIASVMRCKVNKANALTNQEEFSEALELLQEVTVQAKAVGNHSRFIHALNALCSAYTQLELYNESLEFNQQGIDYCLEVGDSSNLNLFYINRGQLFMFLNQEEQAFQYLALGEELLQDDPANTNKVVLLHLIRGALYGQTERYPEAIAEFEKGAKLARSIGHLPMYTQCSLNIISVKFEQATVEEIIELSPQIDSLIAIAEQGKSWETYAAAFLIRARGRMLLEDYDGAQEDIQVALDVAEQIKHTTTVIGAYQVLVELYQQQQNFEEALNYYRQLVSLEDSIEGEAVQKEAKAQEVKLELSQAQYQKELAEEKAQLALERSEKQTLETANWQLLFGFGIAVLGTLVLILLILLIRRKLKAEREKVIVAVQSQDEERKRIALEIHDTVLQEVQAISLFVRNSREHQTFEGLEQSSELIEDLIHDLSSICNDLYPRKLKMLGLVKVADEYVSKKKHLFPEVEFKTSFSTKNAVPMYDEFLCFRILQEAVQNSLKHNKNNLRSIEVSAHLSPTTYVIEICDFLKDGSQGKQLSSDKHLFSIENRVKALAGELTLKEHAGGFSLRVDVSKPGH